MNKCKTVITFRKSKHMKNFILTHKNLSLNLIYNQFT